MDDISPSHIDNCKNNVLVLGEGTIDDINDSVDTAEKQVNINFTKANPKFFLRFMITYIGMRFV